MAITNVAKYSAEKIENHKLSLEQHKETGHPHFYEILVDSIRAIPRTDDLERFDQYELYISRDSEEIEIHIFHGASKRYVSYVYQLKEKTVEPATLNATPEIMEDKITQALRQRDIADYQKRITELEKEVEEAQEYIAEIEEKLLEMSKTTDKQSRFWDMLTAVLVKGNDMIQRNPKLLESIPVIGKELAGSMMSQEQMQYPNPAHEQADSNASFEKMDT
jgi:uncharacterized coiled-coil protein SlyX